LVNQGKIHRKSLSAKVKDRRKAVDRLRANYPFFLDKGAAWQDLIRLTGDEDSSVRSRAAEALGAAFSAVPDKGAAWQDLIRLTGDEDSSVRSRAVEALGAAFSAVPDKGVAWQDLICLTGSEHKKVRLVAGEALGAAFSAVPDKEASWQDLIRLTGSEHTNVRLVAGEALGAAFSAVPDKEASWQDLHRLTGGEDRYVRFGAAHALGVSFSAIPNKEFAWKDLHRLAGDNSSLVRWGAAKAIGALFSAVPDKESAWQDLHRLTGDEDSGVRHCAAKAIGASFSAIPDKESAWQDLHCLTSDEDSGVRSVAAEALGSAFSAVPDKESAWQDLHRLIGDDIGRVRVPANHSLGRASIFKATEAENEEDFRIELENALQYFERSATESCFYHCNPAKFCLPFYKSFYVLTCKCENSEAELEKYMKEAKRASEGSKSKEDLLAAVENLSNALKETQSLRESGLEAAKYDLNSYRRYCDRAAELLDETEEMAPGATRILKRGLPIIDQRIKDLLKEIRDKSEDICKTGNPLEAELGCRIQKHAAFALEKTYNHIEVQKEIDYILRRISLWSDSILDEDVKRYIKDNIEDAASEQDMKRQLSIIRILLEDILSRKLANDERPWYNDRAYLIAVITAIITAIGVLIAIL